jgi:hypothetical protein
MSSDEKKSENAIDKEINNEIEFCINLLEKLSGDPHLYAAVNEEKKIALLIAAGKLSRPTRHEDRMRRGAQKKVGKRWLSRNVKHVLPPVLGKHGRPISFLLRNR